MTLHRHWETFRAALAADRQREVAPERGAAVDFLPAILEVIEKPPSPLGRRLLWALCALALIAVAWAVFGRMDIVAVSRGRIVPLEQVKSIQYGGGSAADGQYGIIRAIHVQEGQAVRRGQFLVEIDPTVASADVAQAGGALRDAELSRARGQAFARFLAGRTPGFAAPAGTPVEVATTQAQLVRSTIAEYQAKSAALVQQRAERQAEQQAAITEMAKLRETLPLFEQQVEARRVLAARGYVSKLLVLQQEAALVERRKDVLVQQSALAKARAAIGDLDQQRAQLRQELARQSFGDLATAERDVRLRTAEQAKAESRAALARVRSPVDGVVTGLAVHTIGGVIQTGEPMMTIVPAGSRLIVEAHVANQDVGFLRAGQAATVKLDAFPFTSYGTLDGRLLSVSADSGQSAAPAPGNGRPAPTAPAPDLLAYTVRVGIDPASVTRLLAKSGCASQSPCARRVIPGMAATAEIRTGRRRVIAYLLDPVMGTLSEAGRER